MGKKMVKVNLAGLCVALDGSGVYYGMAKAVALSRLLSHNVGRPL